MKAIEQLERLKKMNRLIKAECTGTPNEFSAKLGISRRQMYSDIELISDMGIEVTYSKTRRTFHYCSKSELEVSYSLKVIPKDTTKRINGGFLEKIRLRAFFMH